MKSKSQIVREIAQNEIEKMLLAHGLDKLETCRMHQYLTSTRFLDLRGRTMVHQAVQQSGGMDALLFAGGYEDAERTVAVFFPDYMTQQEAKACAPIAVLRIVRQGRTALSHRDYLGSLMGLQIERECIGDILVHEQGADVVVLADVAAFLQLHLQKVGQQPVTVSAIGQDEVQLAAEQLTMRQGNVAAMRLDSVVAEVFGLSRGEAQAAVAKGLVFLNHLQCGKAEKLVAQGDKITLRGTGRANILELSGISRKGRQFLQYTRTN